MNNIKMRNSINYDFDTSHNTCVRLYKVSWLEYIEKINL